MNLTRAGTSARRIVYSSNEEDDKPPRRGPFDRPPQIDDDDEDDFQPLPPAVSRYRKAARRNPFIEPEAGVDGDASADEDNDDADDLEGFIVADDVF